MRNLRNQGGLDPSVVDGILGQNACEFYGFGATR